MLFDLVNVILLPLIDPLVVVMFTFVVDIFPEDVLVPLVEILPVDDMSHCDVQTPTPVCSPTENPPLFLITPSV